MPAPTHSRIPGNGLLFAYPMQKLKPCSHLQLNPGSFEPMSTIAKDTV
ncbi:MAG: hypothetical protein BWZ07_00732 [Alphaproteobacteria bacterium ADurb.BinA280]|jgi:hypothetical protein|nr:MAG: hypothetical protein BWZ07_00732 [Alphaproteobacteria bacterium ADurb.BinA280]